MNNKLLDLVELTLPYNKIFDELNSCVTVYENGNFNKGICI